MESMVERVGAAVVNTCHDFGVTLSDAEERLVARAAIAAMREPIDQMLMAAQDVRLSGPGEDGCDIISETAFRDIWAAAIDAALTEPESPERPMVIRWRG